MSSHWLPACSPPLVPVAFAHFVYFHAWIYRQSSPLLRFYKKYLLIISQNTPSALCVLEQGKGWCLKACEQLARSRLLIMLTTVISLFPGTRSSDLLLSSVFGYNCQPLYTGHTVPALRRVKKSWYEEKCCRTGTTLDNDNLSKKYRDDFTKCGPAFVSLSLNTRLRDWVTGTFFRDMGYINVLVKLIN